MDLAPRIFMELFLRLEEARQPAPPVREVRHVIVGDEDLAEWNYQSRTNHPSWQEPYPCTPAVYRFYPEPRVSGDHRVNISSMLSAYCALNGENDRDDPKTRYLFNAGTALFNSTGYPRQAYITMSGNELRIVDRAGDWLKFVTLTPWNDVNGKTHATHPHLVHRFDLVCWNKKPDGTWYTRHHPNTPQGIVDYFLVTNEGYAWINSKYVREV